MKKSKPNDLTVICAPFSVGGPNFEASDGPEVLLKAGLSADLKELGFKVKLVAPEKDLLEEVHEFMNKKITYPKDKIKNLDLIVKINNWLSKQVYDEVIAGSIPITLGGDHSLAIGTISGICDGVNALAHGLAGLSSQETIGVLWIDRHLDAHSPKNTPSWRAHGMPVAAAIADKNFDPHPDFLELLSVGKSKILPKVKKENFVQIAIGEKSKIDPGTKWFSMEDIDTHGINKIVDEAISYLEQRVNKIYVAWDIDSLNVTGTGTSGDEQLTLREGLVIARAVNDIRKKGKLIGFEMMEVAPKLEKPYLRGQTVSYAIQLICTSFGEGLFNNYGRMTRNINMHAD